MRKIAFIPGDGVGIDVAVEAEKVLEAVVERSALELQVDHFDYGAQKYLDSGVGIPDEQIEDFQRNYAAIFIGALGDPAIPDGKHVREILLALRLKLDLFVNYSPIKLLSSKHCPLKDKKPEDIDFVVFRENLEGVNAFIGGTFREGTAEEELIQQSIISRRGMRRILQHTFEFARHKGMKKVIICNHRPPQIFPLKLWTDQINEIGREFPNLEK